MTPGGRLILAVSRVWAWVFLAGLIAFFTVSVSITSDGVINFLSVRNAEITLMTITAVVLMGLGQTFVIISGGIDLSVGWIDGPRSVVSAEVMVAPGRGGRESMARGCAASLAALVVAALFGATSGTIIAKLGVPSFIVTLGVSFVARGVALIISGGNVVERPATRPRDLGNEALFYVVPGEGGGISSSPSRTWPAKRSGAWSGCSSGRWSSRGIVVLLGVVRARPHRSSGATPTPSVAAASRRSARASPWTG